MGQGWRTSPRRSPRRTWPASRRSTSSTARCARSSTTTCRCRATPGARSPRAASSRGSSSTRWTTSSRSPTARTPTSSPTRPATRRWASTRCGRCATSSPASATRRSCPTDAADAPAPRGPARLPPQPDRRATPLFRKFGAKALDGHPTPATPFVKLSTGASGVGVASSIGLALAAREYYGAKAPRVHVVEGEGGLTPGRVAEALAAAGAASLDNLVFHVDWNQASIDSNRVCREDGTARRLRAVDADGALLPARLERDRGAGRARLPAGDRGAADGRFDDDRPADRRSCTAR